MLPKSRFSKPIFGHSAELKAKSGNLNLFLRILPFFPRKLSGMFRRSASLAIPHLKSFAAIPSVTLMQLLGTRIATFSCHTNRSVKLPSFRNFQDQILTTNKEKWGKKKGPVFRKVYAFDVSRAVGIARFKSVSESQPHRTIQCH